MRRQMVGKCRETTGNGIAQGLVIMCFIRLWQLLGLR